jgi:hypothetical protein
MAWDKNNCSACGRPAPEHEPDCILRHAAKGDGERGAWWTETSRLREQLAARDRVVAAARAYRRVMLEYVPQIRDGRHIPLHTELGERVYRAANELDAALAATPGVTDGR